MTEVHTAAQARPALDGLVEALDRVIGSGAVVCGDLVITLAEVELIRLDLRLLLTGIQGEDGTT
jgi:hypothetical protein